MIVGLSGYAQSGKNTVASFFEQYEQRAFADPMRKVLYELNPIVKPGLTLQNAIDENGWDKAKVRYPEIRRLLQVLGTEIGRNMWGENFWVHQAMRGIHTGFERIVFTDVRFPNEFEAIKNAGGINIRVVREGVEAVNNHPSESALDGFDFDFILENNGSIEELKFKVDVLLRFIDLFTARPFLRR